MTDITIEQKRTLLDTARDFATRAYVPYSHFPVGAAILVEDGSVIGGVNIENASYPLTICGERSAVVTAASRGHRTILAVAVSAPKAPATTPCGACRQVLNEFKPTDAEMLVLLDEGDTWQETTLSALLPAAFGPRDLERADDA
ncbi:MAG: cytidine deaminase [Thermomicrobiales bacterium]|nr:cytidine deaminase [Thermomicrobiales bacterium]MCO5223970.1 cytidine deaminase [Thermomicrobiales bacterium]MCO5226784.1 cytidine deaminase [Thermomicrobiales bacterium]